MKYLLTIIFIFLSFTIMAKNLEGKLTVSTLTFDKVKDNYRVSFIEKAAFYRADKKIFPCLEISLKERKAILISYDPRKMTIESCKENKDKK